MNKHAEKIKRWASGTTGETFYYEKDGRRVTLKSEAMEAAAEIERLEAELAEERAKFNAALITIGTQADELAAVKGQLAERFTRDQIEPLISALVHVEGFLCEKEECVAAFAIARAEKLVMVKGDAK